METFVLTMHIISSILLILLVLAQSGKGAQAGAMFGGATQTAFGAEGGSILTKITTTLAVIFMLSSISLTVIQNKSQGNSVMNATSANTTEATEHKSTNKK